MEDLTVFLARKKSDCQKRIVRLEKQESNARDFLKCEPNREDVKEDLNNIIKVLDRNNALIELIEEIEEYL